MSAMTELQAVLAAQAAAWNRGDIDAFCAFCTDDTTYLGAGSVTTGRDAVAARYRAAYPDRAAMGTLALAIERVENGDTLAVVVARWSVGNAGGRALLVFRREAEGWRLAYDATLAG